MDKFERYCNPELEGDFSTIADDVNFVDWWRSIKNEVTALALRNFASNIAIIAQEYF